MQRLAAAAAAMPLHAAAARMSPPLACRHSPQPAGRPSTERGSLVCNGTLSADDISTMLDDFFYDAQDVSRASISFENANITGLNLAYATAVAFKIPNQPFIKLSFKDCIIARNQVRWALADLVPRRGRFMGPGTASMRPASTAVLPPAGACKSEPPPTLTKRDTLCCSCPCPCTLSGMQDAFTSPPPTLPLLCPLPSSCCLARPSRSSTWP